MHCQEIGVEDHVCANVLCDIFYKHLAGDHKKRLGELNGLIQKAYDQLGTSPDHKVGWFEKQYLCDKSAPHKSYPELQTSVMKTRKVRYLIPVCLELCKKFKNPRDAYTMRRFYCLRNIAAALDIVDQNPWFLEAADYANYKQYMNNFLSHYLALAKGSAKSGQQIGQFQYSFVPKFHFLCHIIDDAEYLSPKAFWCYGGESMVGLLTGIAQSCLSGSPPWKVTETLCTKYRVNKHLQFSEMVVAE